MSEDRYIVEVPDSWSGHTFAYDYEYDDILISSVSVEDILNNNVANFVDGNYLRAFTKAEIIRYQLDNFRKHKMVGQKYNIILFEDKASYGYSLYTALCYDIGTNIVSDDSAGNEELNSSKYQFTKEEIDSLRNARPKYAEIIRLGMREVKDEN